MRIIARLDVKNEWVIKGIQMEGLRKVGAPVCIDIELAKLPKITGAPGLTAWVKAMPLIASASTSLIHRCMHSASFARRCI